MVFCGGISLIFAVFVLISTGCKKEENNETNNSETVDSYLEINGSKHLLTKGALDIYPKKGTGEPDSYNDYFYVLSLVSESIDFNIVDGETDYEFTGNYIKIFLFSTTENELEEGEYLFSDEEISSANSFAEAFFGVFDTQFEGKISDGKVNVTKDGDDHVIKFDLKGENGEIVKGYYKGDLIENKVIY